MGTTDQFNLTRHHGHTQTLRGLSNPGSNDEIQWGVGNVMKGALEPGFHKSNGTRLDLTSPGQSQTEISHSVVSVSYWCFAVRKYHMTDWISSGRKLRSSRIWAPVIICCVFFFFFALAREKYFAVWMRSVFHFQAQESSSGEWAVEMHTVGK